jgi:hypothetical protein
MSTKSKKITFEVSAPNGRIHGSLEGDVLDLHVKGSINTLLENLPSLPGLPKPVERSAYYGDDLVPLKGWGGEVKYIKASDLLHAVGVVGRFEAGVHPPSVEVTSDLVEALSKPAPRKAKGRVKVKDLRQKAKAAPVVKAGATPSPAECLREAFTNHRKEIEEGRIIIKTTPLVTTPFGRALVKAKDKAAAKARK